MATLTINTTGAQDSRIVVAFGKELTLAANGSPRNATAAEVKAAVIAYVAGVVRKWEQAAAVDAAVATAVASLTTIDPS
jgi:hypothetical protein